VKTYQRGNRFKPVGPLFCDEEHFAKPSHAKPSDKGEIVEKVQKKAIFLKDFSCSLTQLEQLPPFRKTRQKCGEAMVNILKKSSNGLRTENWMR